LQGQDLKTRIVSVRLSPEEIDADTSLSALKEVLDASGQGTRRRKMAQLDASASTQICQDGSLWARHEYTA